MGKNGDFWGGNGDFFERSRSKCLESSPVVFWVQIHVSLLIPTCTINTGMKNNYFSYRKLYEEMGQRHASYRKIPEKLS